MEIKRDYYLKQLISRKDKSVLDNLIHILASLIGSLTNPKKIADTFASVFSTKISQTTIDGYIDYSMDR